MIYFYRQTDMFTYEKINKAIEDFDFEKVEKVMKFLDWRWATKRGFEVPTIKEMEDTVRSLAASTVSRLYENDNKYFHYTRTGGFCVTMFNCLCDGEREKVVIISFEVGRQDVLRG